MCAPIVRSSVLQPAAIVERIYSEILPFNRELDHTPQRQVVEAKTELLKGKICDYAPTISAGSIQLWKCLTVGSEAESVGDAMRYMREIKERR